MKIRAVFVSIAILVVFTSNSLQAQVKVRLKLDETTKSFAGQSLFCDKNYKCGLFQNEQEKAAKFGDDDIPIQVWRSGKDFLLSIDTNGNNNLADEKKIFIKNGSTAIFKIRKRLASGASFYFPFEVTHESVEKGGEIIDRFSIVAHYLAVGTIKYGKCLSKIALNDMDRDGKFSVSDASRGTNLQIDVNNDGKFWGKAEFHKTNEIIEFCGQNFLISTMNNNWLGFSVTDLKLAKVGETVPPFSVALLDGSTISADALKGRSYVLDFWASWCVPCVATLPEIKQLKAHYENRVNIFSVNVDVGSRRKLAEEIIRNNQISDFSTIRGLGDKDPFWKTFGGANLNRLSIPLYVLIDKNGQVRYADSGGDGLSELKSSIEKLPSN